MALSATEYKNKLVNEFSDFESYLVKSGKWHLNDFRKNAFDRFSEIGFPNAKHEEWKYTNISFLYNSDFNLSISQDNSNIKNEQLNQFIFDDLFENLLVFVNGFYSKELSKIVSSEKIIIKSISESLVDNFDLIEQYLKMNNSDKYDSFSELNSAFHTDGAFIVVPDNTEDVEPIHILYINDVEKQSNWSNLRNLILVGENAQIRLVETCQTIGEQSAFTNSVTEIHQKTGSTVNYYKLQNDKGKLHFIGTTNIYQANNSTLNSSTISLKGKFVRNNLNTRFLGKHSEANFNGFYFLDSNDFVDNHTLADHVHPECNSNETYKGIINDKAHAVFNGKIVVRQQAQKTNAYQSNKNILLTNDAKINTKPQLEIFADDVKCSHGATTGYLDKEALFYLRARGISEETARALLLNAFASDVISKIDIPELRDNIKNQVAERLKVDDIYFCGFLTK